MLHETLEVAAGERKSGLEGTGAAEKALSEEKDLGQEKARGGEKERGRGLEDMLEQSACTRDDAACDYGALAIGHAPVAVSAIETVRIASLDA